jgi:hypothetical protein
VRGAGAGGPRTARRGGRRPNIVPSLVRSFDLIDQLPRGRSDHPRKVGEPDDTRAVGVHGVDVLVATAGAREGYLPPTGRPGGVSFHRWAVGEPDGTRSVGPYVVDVAEKDAFESYLAPCVARGLRPASNVVRLPAWLAAITASRPAHPASIQSITSITAVATRDEVFGCPIGASPLLCTCCNQIVPP